MNDPSAVLTTTDLPDGVRFILPSGRRDPAAIIVPGIVGIILACVAIFGPMGGLRGWSLNGVGNIIGSIVSLVFGLPFLGMGLLFIGVGVFSAVGHLEVELRGDRLRGVGRIGPLRVGRWKPVAKIERLTIRRPEAKKEKAPSLSKPRLMAKITGAKKESTIAYADRPILEQLARDLSRRCGVVLPDKLGSSDEPHIEIEPGVDQFETDDSGGVIIERSTPDVETAEIPAQPAGSLAVITRNADGITIEFPPKGFKGQARGLLMFGLIWSGCVGVIFLFVAVLGTQQPGKSPLPILIFLTFFLLIGVGMLLGAISVARRTAIFDVVNGALLVSVKGLRGVKHRQWDTGEVRDVRMGPSGTTVNDKAIQELQVIPRQGDKVGFLGWRDEEEIRWTAAELRGAMGISGRKRK